MRLGVPPDAFCELAAITLDDIGALSEGAATPSPRVTALLRLLKGAGRQKIGPILSQLHRPKHVWLTVPAFPSYQVSDQGFVRRSALSHKGSLRTLKAVSTRDGYLSVTLYRTGKPERRRIHRLVCEAFHGPAPTDRPLACHRDGNKTNNAASNLYWGSGIENAADWQEIRRDRIAKSVHRPYTRESRKRLRSLERATKLA